MTSIHPREEWQDPAKPVKGPAPRGQAHTWVIHYPAGNAEPTGTQVAPYLRGVQASYLASRKYSLGYSWGVAQDGSKWEIRGDDFNPASNPGKKVEGNFNNVSRSIFVMVKGDDPATPAAVAAINEIIATHPDWDVIIHGDVDYTACCGAGLIGQVRSGVIGATPPPAGPDPDLIYAGIDWNSKDYNKYDDPNAWIIPASGGGLVIQSDLSVRCASIRNDEVIIGAHNGYMRPQTTASFTVPFEVSGQAFIHERLDDVTLIPSGQPPHWEWGFNFLPVFVDEDNNIVTGMYPSKTKWNASGQIDKAYGIPRESVYVGTFDHDAEIGAWHSWRMVVPEIGTHEVYWDNKLMYRVVEKTPPAPWWDRPLKVALRFDFYDVSLKFNPTSYPPVTPPEGSPDMFFFVVANDPSSSTPETWLLCDGTQLAHVVDGHGAGVFTNAGTGVVRSASALQTEGLIKSCRTTNSCPPEWRGTGWQSLWDNQSL